MDKSLFASFSSEKEEAFLDDIPCLAGPRLGWPADPALVRIGGAAARHRRVAARCLSGAVPGPRLAVAAGCPAADRHSRPTPAARPRQRNRTRLARPGGHGDRPQGLGLA